MSIVKQIVDRQHAATPWRQVLRVVISRLRGGKQYWRSLPRETRRQVVAEVYTRQRANWRLYVAVVSGDLSLMED